jgi:acetate kinase
VAVLVRRTGQTHPQVNSELNRLSGIDRISEATVRQLEKRLEVAERLARG